MSDEDDAKQSETTEAKSVLSVGKQARDIAKATDPAVDTVEKAARFINSVFGRSISNAIGLVEDKLAYYRLEKAIMLAEKLEANLSKKGVPRRYVPVSFGLPIIEKASVEEDENLSEKWANLLTNAADATYDKPLRRNYSTILGDMEPVDTLVLDSMVKEYLDLKPEERERALFVKALVASGLKLDETTCENALRNLIRLGVLKPGVVSSEAAMIGDHEIASYKDTEMVGITQLGVDFHHAVNLRWE